MTYQHALRHLTAPEQKPNAVALSLHELIQPAAKSDALPLFLCFTRDKQGSTAASMLRSVLCEAGVRHLHWIDDAELDPRARFLLDGKPIPPPLLSEHADTLHRMQADYQRAHASPVSLTPAERSCAVLTRLAMSSECRIILLEMAADAPLLRLFATLVPRLSAITVLSESDDIPYECIREGTREVISLACGQAMFRRISDACAKSGSRLTLVAGANCQRTALTPGSQTLHYRTLSDCRIPSGSETAARAGFLTMQCILTLERYGVSLPPDAVRTGMSRAELSHCYSLLSIYPLLIADAIKDQHELEMSLRDLNALTHALPAPRHVWLDPALQSAELPHGLIDTVHAAGEPLSPPESGTALILGSPAFIREALSTGAKRRL